jgi:tetratricopeptide (TPR) repeat protein
LQALELCKLRLPEVHPHFARSLYNLAHIYCHQLRYKEAKPLYMEALEIFQQQLGADHPYTIDCRSQLIIVCDHLKFPNGELPNFKRKSKKGNSQKKPKGFGKK